MFARIFLTTFFIGITISSTAQQKRFTFSEPKMGSPFTIIFYSDDSLRAGNIARQCFQLVDSFVLVFSDYIDSSELSKLSASSAFNALPVAVSPALLDILVLSKNAFDESSGAFDITVGPLVKLWRKARKAKQFPTDELVQQAHSLIGFGNIIIDTVSKTATLSKPGMQLDLGGIAQGWIAQKIIDFLISQQITSALVNVSGDIVMTDAPPGSAGWTIGVNVPESKDELLPKNLLMHNKAVTTSGDAYQYMEHNGKRYSHIIDPRTGYGITSQRNVTVIAEDGATADWLTKACSIMPIRKAKRLVTKLGAEVLIAQFKKGRLVFHATKGLAKYWKPATQ